MTSIVVDKLGKPDEFNVIDAAWRSLFQRFENTLLHGNFPGGHTKAFGTVYTDATNGEQLRKLMRKMASYNPIPNQFGGGYRNKPVVRVIEDPSERDSKHSSAIQACDVMAYFLFQSLQPNSYVKRKKAVSYFSRLQPILNRHATTKNALGIVMLLITGGRLPARRDNSTTWCAKVQIMRYM